MASIDDATAAAIIETANSVMVTRLRSWSQGRTSIQDVHRHVERTLDLIFSPARPHGHRTETLLVGAEGLEPPTSAL